MRFIADASHELRTPLTALVTFNDLLARGKLAQEEPASSFIIESKGQLEKLDRITSDLLDLSRLESRLSSTELVRGDLRSSIISAAQNVGSVARAKGITLAVDLPDEPVAVMLNEAAIEKAIHNLLDNAIKHSPREGEVRIKLSTRESSAAVSVIDQGPGIPEDELELIFDRFHRGSDASYEGSGLGLSITKEIVAIHGGVVQASNQKSGGSSFDISLPIAAEEGPEKSS